MPGLVGVVFRRGGIPWAAGTILLIAAALSLYFFTGSASSGPSLAPQANSSDISFGPEQAQVVVMEYSDFECAFCAQYAPILAGLREKYGDRVRFVYRFLPLNNHRYSGVSAQAAYAAYLQGKFWEMHDLIYQNQEEWVESGQPDVYFQSYADSLGLDMDKFREDYAAQSTRDFIYAEAAAGDAAGIDHTPWFIVNDRVVSPRTAEQFQAIIEAAL